MKNESIDFKNVLMHLVMLIKENMETRPSISTTEDPFEQGKTLAYYEVADLVVECGRIFEFRLSDLGIDDFKPEKLL